MTSLPEGAEAVPTAQAAALAVQQTFDMKLSLVQSACDSAAKQYDDYYKSFQAFDGKAQGTATISGFILAAVVAFIDAKQFDRLLMGQRIYNYVFVLLPPLFALFGVIASLIASRVRDVTVPFDAVEQIREAGDLADLPYEQFSKEHVFDYYLARLRHWQEAVGGIADEVELKAKWVKRAQLLMVSSLGFLLILFMVTFLKALGFWPR